MFEQNRNILNLSKPYELIKMNKIPFLIIFVVLILFCSTLDAQRITVGVKGGLCFSGLSGGTSNNPTFDSNSFKLGGELGIYGEYHISEKLSYSLGIEYSLQGGLNKFKAFPVPASLVQPGLGPYLYSDFKSDINLNYLSVPVLARQLAKLPADQYFSICLDRQSVNVPANPALECRYESSVRRAIGVQSGNPSIILTPYCVEIPSN